MGGRASPRAEPKHAASMFTMAGEEIKREGERPRELSPTGGYCCEKKYLTPLFCK